MMCFLKRVLPFALTLIVGLVLGSFFKTPQPVRGALMKYEGTGAGIGPAWNRSADREFNYDRPFPPQEVDLKAHILRRPEPQYTEEARKNQVEGTVILRAVFAEDGVVRDIRVVSELPDGLTERAVEAARGIKFSPALKDGRAVPQYIQIEYYFHLY